MRRLDNWLVELQLAPSRTKAQALITNGDVEVYTNGLWQKVTQSSRGFAELDCTTVRVNSQSAHLRYVSRGGLKLEYALERIQLDVTGMRALDIGMSTGGFTDCLLQRGCQEVVGIDVGTGQLAKKLCNDRRVTMFEGINVRNISAHPEVLAALVKGIGLFVVDVSFISLQLVIPPLQKVLPDHTEGLILVKPQFELDASVLDKNGIVREPSLQQKAVDQVLRSLKKCGFSIHEYFPSQIKGQDGNQEFFVYIQIQR